MYSGNVHEKRCTILLMQNGSVARNLRIPPILTLFEMLKEFCNQHASDNINDIIKAKIKYS